MATAIKISPELQSMMEERGIREEDLQQVVNSFEEMPHLRNAEGNRFLAKKRLGNFTVNVEFTRSEDTVDICNIYSYVVSLDGEQA